MQTIKFSSDYPKLHGQTSAELLAVRNIRIDRNTPPELITYDTVKRDGTRYPLRSGNYLQLIFIGNYHIPFCTIRSVFPARKEEFYRKHVGDIFEIEVSK